MHPGVYEYIKEASSFPCVCDNNSSNLKGAAENGCINCTMRFLYEAGDVRGGPAILRAAQYGHNNIVKLLIPFEAGVRDHSGTTALMEAAQNGHSDVVRLLIPHEAGCVALDSLTALKKAVFYQNRDCFELLRQSPAELEASKIPPFMFAMYDGDSKAAFQHINEWNNIFEDGLNILDFSLLRGRRVFMQNLLSFVSSKTQLSSAEESLKWARNSMAQRLLFPVKNQLMLKNILDIVCSCGQKDRSRLAAEAIFRHVGAAYRRLRPLCTPQKLHSHCAIYQAGRAEYILRDLKGVKNAGLLENIAETRIGEREILERCREYFASNALKQKQLETAIKHTVAGQSTGYKTRDENNPAWRETEAEACLNRGVLLQAREFVWETLQPTRQGSYPRRIRPITAKLERNGHIIRDAFRYLFAKVEEMLKE